jgi:hypothetical protein
MLAVLAVAAAVLVAVAFQADIADIADEGWKDNALYALAGALGVLGLAVAAIAWTLPMGPVRAVAPRVLTLVAVLAAFAGAVVIGLADQQGGTVATPTGAVAAGAAASPDAVATDPQGEPPIGIGNAFEPATVTETAIPIVERTIVTLQLNPTGRQLVAAEMRCRPIDLFGTAVTGTAIGGTWAEPLVVLNQPVRVDGSTIARCRRVIVRLPVQAGIASPSF